MRIYSMIFLVCITLVSCQENNGISEKDFIELMNNVAYGWSTQNTDLALSSFDVDAIYMEPPNSQYYRGHGQLKPYFNELTDVHKMTFHSLWFNPQTQSGAGEFTFSYGKEIADTGVVIVEIKNGKIKFWREYHKKGPVDFGDFIKIEGKEWKWNIGNYPEPKDTIASN